MDLLTVTPLTAGAVLRVGRSRYTVTAAAEDKPGRYTVWFTGPGGREAIAVLKPDSRPGGLMFPDGALCRATLDGSRVAVRVAGQVPFLIVVGGPANPHLVSWTELWRRSTDHRRVDQVHRLLAERMSLDGAAMMTAFGDDPGIRFAA